MLLTAALPYHRCRWFSGQAGWPGRITGWLCNRAHLQGREQLLEQADLLANLAVTAAECPRFAVTVAGGSLLGALLQAIGHLAGSAEKEGQVGCTLRAACCAR